MELDNVSLELNKSREEILEESEDTCCEPGYETIIIPVIYTGIVILGCLGNFLVILVVIRTREHYKNTTNLFILNLSFADLFFVLFCVPFHVFTYTHHSWPFGDFMCRLVHFVQYLSMVTSIGTLVSMSLDRFLAVCFPIQTKHLRTPQSALIICIIVWIFAIVISSPMGAVYTVYVYKEHGNISVCADDWDIYNPHYKPRYYLILFIIAYVLPTLLISVFSTLTVLQLWAMEATDGPSERRSYIAKRRVTRLIFVVVAAFALCWLPSHIMWLWIGYFPSTWRHEYFYYYLRLISHVLSYANSCMNPILYAFLSSGFRRGFKKAIRCRGGSGFKVRTREEVIEFSRRRGTGSRSTYKGRFSTALSTLNRPQTHVVEEML